MRNDAAYHGCALALCIQCTVCAVPALLATPLRGKHAGPLESFPSSLLVAPPVTPSLFPSAHASFPLWCVAQGAEVKVGSVVAYLEQLGTQVSIEVRAPKHWGSRHLVGLVHTGFSHLRLW